MRTKILYKLLVLVAFTLFAGMVYNTTELERPEKAVTLAVSSLFGGLSISKESDTTGKVIFDKIFEDVPGGAILDRTRLKTATTEITAGALLYITGGVAELVKTAICIAGCTTLVYRVGKNHEFKVGDIIMLVARGDAEAITAIDTSNATYDEITIGTTLGSTPAADTVIVEASAATSADDSVQKYVANAILRSTINVGTANPGCSGVVRGSVREDALPFSAHALDKTALSLIRFV